MGFTPQDMFQENSKWNCCPLKALLLQLVLVWLESPGNLN
jgi:hypothetical protein